MSNQSLHSWVVGVPNIWSNHQNGRRCMTPSAPPPPPTHSGDLTRGSVPVLLNEPSAGSSSLRLGSTRYCPQRLSESDTFFPPSPASLFFGGWWGFFLNKGASYFSGGGCCWLEMSVSIWTEWRDTQCVWHLLVDKNTRPLFMCDQLSVKRAWFFARFYFFEAEDGFWEDSFELWGLFFSLRIASSTCSHSPHHVSGETWATLVKWKLVVVVPCTPFLM